MMVLSGGATLVTRLMRLDRESGRLIDMAPLMTLTTFLLLVPVTSTCAGQLVVGRCFA